MPIEQRQPAKYGKAEQPQTTTSGPPKQRPRWMYARGKGWATFSPEDDEELEQSWQKLGRQHWANKIKSPQNKEKEERKRVKEEIEKGEIARQEAELPYPKRPIPVAPPSGVDAVRAALQNFADMPDKARRKVKETANQASGATFRTSTGGASTPLREIKNAAKQASQHNPQGDTHKKGEEADRKPSSHWEKTRDGDGKVMFNEILDPDQPEEERKSKVQVMQDKLFDVDLEKMVLYPVFWKGVFLKVVRATWFYSSSTDGSYIPISWDDDLSKDLDAAYEQAKPWKYNTSTHQDGEKEPQDEKKKPADKAETPHEETKETTLWPLPSMADQGKVLFENSQVGSIFSKDIKGRFLSVMGGSTVVRGFDKAEELARKKSNNTYMGFSLPWAAGDQDGDDDEEGKSKKQLRQEQGSTFGAQRGQRKEGAARTGGAPEAGGGADGSNASRPSNESEKDDRQSFAARLFPSSDSITRPAVALLRMVGLSSAEASEEGKRQVKQKMTEYAIDRERSSDKTSGHGFGEAADTDNGAEEDLEIEQDLKDEPPELVLAVHGIGQQLAEDFDALDFVYDVERLRNLSNKRASDTALRRMARGRRAQYIPICWRRSLTFDEQPDGNDNFYTLDNITNSAAIPIIRNIISKVMLDVPFYLSRHRQKMVDSVIAELNRTYRLFCRRNPEFEKKGGRVSIIGHSLGSALSADILSAQPSKVPLLCELEKDKVKENKHLLFNVKNTFFIGSPVGFFFYLDGCQLIARRGTQRNPVPDQSQDPTAEEDDATLDVVGKYGCLATETIYNIFNPTDPVAFQLAPTVDSRYASLVQPIPIVAAAGALLEALALPRLSVSKIFEKYGDHPFQGEGKIVRQAQAYQGSNDDSFGTRIVEPSEFIQKVRKMKQLDLHRAMPTETGSAKKRLQPRQILEDEHMDLDSLERGERRFHALNPHGSIDFLLSNGLGFSEYLDMLGAHVCYWTHPDFATFVLTQLFAR